MVQHNELAQLLLESGVLWASRLNVPWFLAGAGFGVPVAVGTVSTGDSKLLSLVTTLGGVLGGVAADRLSTTALDTLAGSDLSCYDVLTKGVGPACLALVVLSRNIRSEPTVAVKPAAFVALVSLLLEPLFSAYVLGTAATTTTAAAATRNGATGLLALQHALSTVTRGRRKSAAAAAAAAEAAVSRARWLTGGAQLALWAAVVLAYANLSLRLSRADGGSGRTVAGYMTALRSLAAKKRGTGGWVRIDRWGKGGGGWRGEGDEGGTAPNSPVPGGWGGGWGVRDISRPRAHSLFGSLYETLVSGGRWGGGGVGGRVGAGEMALSQYQTMDDTGPPFERGEVTVRSIYCFGLDAAITGRPPSAALNTCGAGAGADHDAAGGGGGECGGGIVAGGTSRPFYVTITLGGVTAKTSPRPGFSPSFTEVFPLGCDCPIRGAFLTIAVVDSFETGRSVRGDRIVGEVHLPLDAAQLVPGTGASSQGGGGSSCVPSSGNESGGGGGGSGAAYRLSGDWELQGALGGSLGGARVGADIVIHGPPSPSSAAGKLRRRRESVGWYAR